MNNITPSTIDLEIKRMIDKYRVYGAECVINALVRATINEPYLHVDQVFKMFKYAYKHELERKERKNG